MLSVGYELVSFAYAVNEDHIPYEWWNKIELARNYLVALKCR
jgi:hypothetical protein